MALMTLPSIEQSAVRPTTSDLRFARLENDIREIKASQKENAARQESDNKEIKDAVTYIARAMQAQAEATAISKTERLEMTKKIDVLNQKMDEADHHAHPEYERLRDTVEKRGPLFETFNIRLTRVEWVIAGLLAGGAVVVTFVIMPAFAYLAYNVLANRILLPYLLKPLWALARVR